MLFLIAKTFDHFVLPAAQEKPVSIFYFSPRFQDLKEFQPT